MSMFVIIGTTTADLFIHSPERFSNNVGDDGFRAGNLIFTEEPLTISMGGNGGNSAYVLAGLGVPTALCGAVGQDPLGEMLGRWLEGRDVNLAGLHRSPTQATSSSTIIMTDAANQVVFHHLGSTAAVRFEAMPHSLLAQADVLLASSFPIMSHMRVGGYAQAVATTRQAGGLTALDIGPAIGVPVTLDELAPLRPHLDYLIGNSHELALLTGLDDWRAAGERLLDVGYKSVVIKRGTAGASVRSQETAADVSAFPVAAKISVGAGDSFNVGFLYGIQQGWPVERALRFGNAVAALVVSSPRGVLDSPTLAEVEAFVDDYP